MDNLDNKPNLPPIYVLALLGPTAMQIIDRHKSNPAIAVFEHRLGPKVARFAAVNDELKTLTIDYKKRLARSNAELDVLDVATHLWDGHLQIDLAFDSEDINIVETRAAAVAFDRAQNVMKMYRESVAVAYAKQALDDLEAKHSSAKQAYDAAQAGRVAVQETQRALQLAGAAVHEELIRLRKALRRLLGSNHFDYQRLRIVRGRGSAEPPVEPTPATAEPSAESPRGSRPDLVS